MLSTNVLTWDGLVCKIKGILSMTTKYFSRDQGTIRNLHFFEESCQNGIEMPTLSIFSLGKIDIFFPQRIKKNPLRNGEALEPF